MIRNLFHLPYGHAFCCMLLLLSACQFEQDTNFIPYTEAAYWLTTDSTGVRSLTKWDEGGLMPHYENNWGLGTSAISAIEGEGASLWYANPLESTVVQLSLPAETPIQTYSSAELTPHFMAVGNSHILVVDSTRKQLEWIERETSLIQIDSLELEGAVLEVLYQPPYFAIAIKEGYFRTYHEWNRRLLTVDSFAHPIIGIEFVPKRDEIEILLDSVGSFRYEGWSLNARDITRKEPVSYQKIRFSPYLRQETGREWTDRIELRGQIIAPIDVRGVDDFEVDFLESRLFFVQRDSLFEYGLWTAEKQFIAPFFDRFYQQYFFSTIGEK